MPEAWPPPPNRYTPDEQRLIRRLRTPLAVQRYLLSIDYNHGDTMRSFRRVTRDGAAHCLEATLFAATVLEQQGDPPLVLDLDSTDELAHAMLLFRRRGRWGSVALSRDPGLHGRKAHYRSVRDLVWSYYDPYIDEQACIRGYAVVDLRLAPRADWRTGERNVWAIERFLERARHRLLGDSPRRRRRVRLAYRRFKRAHPEAHPVAFTSRPHWLVPARELVSPPTETHT